MELGWQDLVGLNDIPSIAPFDFVVVIVWERTRYVMAAYGCKIDCFYQMLSGHQFEDSSCQSGVENVGSVARFLELVLARSYG